MVPRTLAKTLQTLATQYPVLTITGPRQSGKTTLSRTTFPSHHYVSLEAPDVRARARTDPRGLLDEIREGAILDEIQHVPEFVSYLQEEVDADARTGRFVLTGSENFALTSTVAQSLAGRTAVIHLLPLDLTERLRFPQPMGSLVETLFAGSYPRIHDRGLDPSRWLGDYVATYIERDLRAIIDIGNLTAFTTFLGLCAGMTAQEVNLSRLGADCGVTHNTIRAWISTLEASFIVFRTPPWLRNPRKRLVKAPKLHFVDSGLCCYLLGIRSADHLRTHPLRGAIFESWVAAEIYKSVAHRGGRPQLFHLREARGAEVDIVLDGPVYVEAKSGATLATDWFDVLSPLDGDRRIVYGGDAAQTRFGIRAIPWAALGNESWPA